MLIERGADLEAKVPRLLRIAGHLIFREGARAIHGASGAVGQPKALKVLLEAGCDPNAADSLGRTALMEVSRSTAACEMAVWLLEAGADPEKTDEVGSAALHNAASAGAVDLIELLVARAPATLNWTRQDGTTPMYMAALGGHVRAVALLLSLGARDKATWKRNGVSSLTAASQGGHEEVVRVLLDAHFEAFGGGGCVPLAIAVAIQGDHARALRLLLMVEGEERQGHWAMQSREGFSMLHHAAYFVSVAATHLLLRAGADEAVEVNGETPGDMVGGALPDAEREGAREALISRMLQRGPAYRARSWAYPAAVEVGATSEAPATGGQEPTAPFFVRVFRQGKKHIFTTRFAR